MIDDPLDELAEDREAAARRAEEGMREALREAADRSNDGLTRAQALARSRVLRSQAEDLWEEAARFRAGEIPDQYEF
ncbi:hypothetical protein ACFY0R_39720 [Streptomyces sp. NPDC001633]|uniref:hypothetical protein n=1 Tax=Streptomyces sp. NPDC001633 TaxID=3364595 RepID=UPI0036C8A2DD